MEAQTKDNIADKGTWIRLLYMILFAVVFNVAELVTWVVVVLQFLFKLLTGRANARLQSFGQDLSAYFQQVVGFLTYHTEEMPYPFGEWPGAAGQGNPAAGAKVPAKKKPRSRAKGDKPADDQSFESA